MRTGIYVYANCTLSIKTEEDGLQLQSMNGGVTVSLTRMTELSLEPGIYRVFSPRALQVTPEPNADIEIWAVDNAKDPWPDLPPALIRMFNVSHESVRRFFEGVDANLIKI